jgi:zinc D-Ala-D-Ala carboxypeptidase
MPIIDDLLSTVNRLILLTSSRSELANTILNSARITLATAHVSGVNDNATARQNIIDTANGMAAARSSYGNAPGGTIQLDTRLLSGLLTLAETYTYTISELAGGSHSENSRHYVGVAADITVINSQQVSAAHLNVAAFMQACHNLGATEVLGPGDAGHAGHIHCAWPRP